MENSGLQTAGEAFGDLPTIFNPVDLRKCQVIQIRVIVITVVVEIAVVARCSFFRKPFP